MNLQTENKHERFNILYKKVNTTYPKKDDVLALREMVNADPSFCASLSPLAASTAEFVINKAVSVPATREAFRANLLTLREELGYETAPSIEKALIDQVALNWLRMIITEQWYTEKMQGSLSSETALFFEKRLSIVQKRYFLSLETLAKIRKLIRSMTIMNVATPGSEQTVNQLLIQSK